MDSKTCFKCLMPRPLTEFYTHHRMADGHLNKCKDCTKNDNNKHRDRNLEKIKKADRERYAANPEKKKANALRYKKENKEKCNAVSREWIKKNPEKRKATTARYNKNHPGRISRYEKARKVVDPAYAMLKRLRVRLHHALRAANGTKSGSTIELIGCSPAELVQHIEGKFLPGMSWENRDLWHIDHKRPCVDFDLTIEAQQLECFHYTNLQPLWWEDNLRKGKRYNQGP